VMCHIIIREILHSDRIMTSPFFSEIKIKIKINFIKRKLKIENNIE